MSKKTYYELIVWAGDHKDDHLLPRDVEFIRINDKRAAIEAIEAMSLNHKEGWIDSWISIKKRDADGEEIEEYSNESLDCSPLDDLPKYILKRIKPLIELTSS
tara:strand:- start:622 stop:930 length:309 start_codon:yes stop_codon:yes gene_type:complete